MRDPVTSRRALFGASAAMLLLSAAEAGAAKAVELDAAVLALAREYDSAIADIDRLAASSAPAEETPEHEAAWSSALDRSWSAVDGLRGVTARTPEGMQAKARVALHAMQRDLQGADAQWRDQASPIELLVADVLAQITGRAPA